MDEDNNTKNSRRNFLKTIVLGSLPLFLKGCGQKSSDAATTPVVNNAASPVSNNVVVFGVDGLRYDTAAWLRENGSPGLDSLYPPIPALSGGGHSVTQPGWADIWTGMPSLYHRAWDNAEFSAMPYDLHIMAKLMNEGFYAIWITGKGYNILGQIPESPHYQVYKYLIDENYPGEYHGDRGRSSEEVFELAYQAFQTAITEDKFVAFVHFRNPDAAGHNTLNYDSYVKAAKEVDLYISELIAILPPETNIIYCSDHGFSFKELGEGRYGHRYSPIGMVATNVDHPQESLVTRTSIGRAIYLLTGNNPNKCFAKELHPDCSDCNYSMYGIDFLF
jgi:predicted AlkP superfamily pyrophosphatase or phosphodiesterase